MITFDLKKKWLYFALSHSWNYITSNGSSKWRFNIIMLINTGFQLPDSIYPQNFTLWYTKGCGEIYTPIVYFYAMIYEFVYHQIDLHLRIPYHCAVIRILIGRLCDQENPYIFLPLWLWKTFNSFSTSYLSVCCNPRMSVAGECMHVLIHVGLQLFFYLNNSTFLSICFVLRLQYNVTYTFSNDIARKADAAGVVLLLRNSIYSTKTPRK